MIRCAFPTSAAVRMARLGVLLPFLAFAAGSCVDGPTGPATPEKPASILVAPPVQSVTPYTIDDYFEDIARNVPGFAGAYWAKDGEFRVLLTDLSRATEAQAALREYAGRSGPSRRPASAPRFIQADYDWRSLATWRRSARALLDLPGVVYLDIDESTNRLRLGVTSEGPSRELVDRSLISHFIPASAVQVESTTAVNRVATLQDRVRPTFGGLQIQTTSQPSCTLGFNAYLSGTKGFTTASHCTNTQGGAEGSVFYQDSYSSGNRIGVESSDPDYFTVQPCTPGRRCRYSDIAFQTYDDSVDTRDGRIYRTTYNGQYSGSLTIDSSHPYFVVRGEDLEPTQGDTLHKIGRTTGWTTGPVTGTCVDTNVANSNVRMLCQYHADMGVGGGDSGSPVFGWHYGGSSGGDEVTLYGSLWGKPTTAKPCGSAPSGWSSTSSAP